MANSWDDNFAAAPYVNGNIFPIRWGNSSEFSASNGGLTLTSNGHAAGFLQADFGANSAQGYGLYSATVSAPSQGAGVCVVMWPSTNRWPGPEIDLVEQYNGKPYMTVHWNSGGSNEYHSYFLPSSINLSDKTTFSMDWERDSLTYYANGQEIVQYRAGGAVPIPKDAADGGQNLSFGAEVSSANVHMTLYDMKFQAPASYSAPVSSSPAPTSSSVQPSSWIDVSAPGAHSSTGGGVWVTEQFSDPGLSHVYAFVMTKGYQAESNWQYVPLDSSGHGSLSMHFQNTGDFVLAVNDPSTQTCKGWSSPITIT